MTALTAFAAVAFALALVMTGAWAIVARGGRSGWIDAIWSFATGAAGVTLALMPLGGAEVGWRQWAVAGMAGLWSLRLGLHIAARTAGGADDPRYAALRDEWGQGWRTRLLMFLQIQAAAAFLLASSIAAAAHDPSPFPNLADFLGVAILLAAVAGEAVADRQLARFRADPANEGRVCDVGLWGLSRHPNYFFEWLGWTAYAIIAIDPSASYGWGFAALAGPAFMYWLLVHVSGIPPLEAHMLRSRGERFRAYQRRVNAFWPGPPATSSPSTEETRRT